MGKRIDSRGNAMNRKATKTGAPGKAQASKKGSDPRISFKGSDNVLTIPSNAGACKDTLRLLYDVTIESDPPKEILYGGETWYRQSFGPILKYDDGTKLEGNVWYTRRPRSEPKLQDLRCVSGEPCGTRRGCQCLGCKTYFRHVEKLQATGSTVGELPPTKVSPLAEKLKESKATPPKTVEPEKSSKSVGWRWVQDGPRPAFAILRIVNGDSADYLFQRITSEEFRLTKLEEDRATSYTVSIGATKRCGCERFRRHQKCKHVDALLSLRKEGKL